MPNGTWNTSGNGGRGTWNWSDTSCWQSGIVADGASFAANIYSSLSAGSSNYCYVSLDTPRTIGTLGLGLSVVTSGNRRIHLSGNPLTLDNGPNKPVVYGNYTGEIFSSGQGSTSAANGGSWIRCDLPSTNGFTASGSTVILDGGARSTQGAIEISSIDFNLGSRARLYREYPYQSCNLLPSVTSYNFTNNSATLGLGTNQYTLMPLIPMTGPANVFVRTWNNGAVEFPEGTFVGVDNTTADYGLGMLVIPRGQQTSSAILNVANSTTIYLYELTQKMFYWQAWGATSIGTNPGAIYYLKNTDATYDTNFTFYDSMYGGNSITMPYYFIHNGSGKLVINGGASRVSAGGYNYPMTWHLGGTNGSSVNLDNEFKGGFNEFGTLNIYKYGPIRWIFSGSGNFAGSFTLAEGIVCVANAGALGGSSAATSSLAAGTTLQIQGGIALNKAATAFTTAGATIENLSGVNSMSFSSLTKNASFSFNISAGSLDFTGPIVGGATTRTLTINGPGTLRLSSTGSTYLSNTTLTSGDLEVSKLANVSTASSLGAPATAQATILLASAGGSTALTHVGSTVDTTDRAITFGGAADTTLTLNSNGSGGSINYTSGGAFTLSGAGAHTLAFGGTNTNTNAFGRNITDGPSGVTTITKSGAGTWSITAASLPFTGKTYLNGGRLDFGATNRTLVNTIEILSGLLTMTTGNSVSASGINFNGSATITAVIAGTTPIVVTNGTSQSAPATMQPDAPSSGSNTFTGNVNVDGCLDLVTPVLVSPAGIGNGRVLGTNNTVQINSTGIVRTKNALTTVQRGRARYHTLTFAAGSRLRIGFAA